MLSVAAGSAMALGLSGHAEALEMDWELSGFAKNETAIFTSGGQTIGQAKSSSDTSENDSLTGLKFENSLNFFVNGTFSEEAVLHAQVNLMYDTEGVSGYKSYEDSSQNDYLRELYLDTVVGPVDLRLGKQQVVWGTADGIKLLDILNPTDWREFVQNTMEDSRIPVWMANVETAVGDAGNLQFVAAQRKENLIPGLNGGGDQGQAFIMKGVDSITGKVNGFYNIVPAMGGVAGTFNGYSIPPGEVNGTLNGVTMATVHDFVVNGIGSPAPGVVQNFANACGPQPTAASAACLDAITQQGSQAPGNVGSGANNSITALIDGANWDESNPNSVFEYMPNATFATFDTFANARSAYRRDYPDELAPNLGMRYKGTLKDSINFSLNYLWHYDANPYVDMSWENAAGQEMKVVAIDDESLFNTGYKTVKLQDPAGNLDCQVSAGNNPCTLVFTEKLNRIHSLGGSFDSALDTEFLGPIILRGEVLYQKDTKTPVIDRTKLGYGDLTGGVQSLDADMVKYVLGADITLFTNLMISGQFIQFVNLDYIDEAGNGTAASGRYTADPAVMHLSNGLKKGEEFKEFYSLFLSKPLGEDQLGRINNIIMYEENDGWWNRMDLEYSFTDEWIGTAEWNRYWGSVDTMFGQFNNSSNIQAGIKYLF